MLKRRTKRKLMAVLFTFAILFILAIANAGAYVGGKNPWCWPWWKC